MEDYNTGVIYNGNIFWLLEAMKNTNKHYNFDTDYHNLNLVKSRQNQIICKITSNSY